MTTDVDEVEPDSGGTAAPDDGTPVDEVKGIGPAYSDRLADIGITTAEELADSEAEEVADRITVPEKTVKKWLKRARKK